MRATRRQHEAPRLELVPMLNLVTVLIPFLLLSAQFVALSAIDVALPSIPFGCLGEDVASTPTLLITEDGFDIAGPERTWTRRRWGQEPDVPCRVRGCPTPEAYDYVGLTRTLAAAKDAWGEVHDVIVIPWNGVSYEVVVRTMDAARRDVDDVDPHTGAPRALFPRVVLAAGVD